MKAFFGTVTCVHVAIGLTPQLITVSGLRSGGAATLDVIPPGARKPDHVRVRLG